MVGTPKQLLNTENIVSNKGQLLQDPFLNTLRREHVPVSIYLVNGIKLQGQIESFRSVRRSVAQHRDPNGLQACYLDHRAGTCSELLHGREQRRRPGLMQQRPQGRLLLLPGTLPAGAVWNPARPFVFRLDFVRPSRPPPGRCHPRWGGFRLAPFRRRARRARLACPDCRALPVARLTCKRKAPDAALFVAAARPMRSRRWPNCTAPPRCCSTSRSAPLSSAISNAT